MRTRSRLLAGLLASAALVGAAALPAAAGVTKDPGTVSVSGLPADGQALATGNLSFVVTGADATRDGSTFTMSFQCGTYDDATGQVVVNPNVGGSAGTSYYFDGQTASGSFNCGPTDYLVGLVLTAGSFGGTAAERYWRERTAADPDASRYWVWEYEKEKSCSFDMPTTVKLLRGAGWPETLIAQAAAVSTATSGRDNYWVDAGTGMLGITSGNYSSDLLLQSPSYNLRAGLTQFNQNGWGYWPKYANGGYLAYLDDANAAVAANPGALLLEKCGTTPTEAGGVDATLPNAEDCESGFLNSLKCFFTPRQETLDGFRNLPSLASDKFPFSVVADVNDTLSILATGCEVGGSCGSHAAFYVKAPGGDPIMVFDSSASPQPAFIQAMRDHREVLSVLIWLTAFAPLVWAIFWGSIPLLRLSRVSDNASGKGGRDE